MITDPLPLTLVLVAITALGFWLEEHVAWARRLGATMLIILFGATLSNLNLVAPRSPVYEVIAGPITSLAIVWLLLAVNLRDLKAAGPRMLLAFALAVVATCAGAFTAALTVGQALPEARVQLAGVMTGTYAGGSVNFVSVSRALGLENSLFTAATAADNVLTALWMGATLMLPVWLRRFYVPRPEVAEAAAGEDSEVENPLTARVALRPFDLLALAVLGLACLLAATAVAAVVPAVPSVLWLTTFALILAQVPAVRRLSGAMALGLLGLNLFFAVIGVFSRVSEIFSVGPQVFYFTAVVVLVHGLVVYGGAWLMKLDVETASVASQAAVGGPSTAMALAVTRGWRGLALPGLMVGLLGYAVGNYAGLAMAALVRSLG